MAVSDTGQLRRLERKRRFFDLRRALVGVCEDNAEVRFLRALVAARFGMEAAALGVLSEAAEKSRGRIERRANEEIAFASMRLGRYGEASAAWSRVIRATTSVRGHREARNAQVLCESLRGTPPLSATLASPARIAARLNALGLWEIPVSSHGIRSEWILDSGANFTIVSESEAASRAFSIRETKAYVSSPLKKNSRIPVRVAVARELQVGTVRLRNVICLVLSDEALSINLLSHKIQGILGLPVFRALGSIRVSAGVVEIGRAEAIQHPEPNLCFDDLGVMVEAFHKTGPLQLVLDTGANATVFYDAIHASSVGRKKGKLPVRQGHAAGAGITTKFRTETVSNIQLEFLNQRFKLSNAILRPARSRPNIGYDGVLGLDGLSGSFALDFRSMQLRLGGSGLPSEKNFDG